MDKEFYTEKFRHLIALEKQDFDIFNKIAYSNNDSLDIKTINES